MILMSEAAFKLLAPEQLGELCLIVNAGEHLLKDKTLPATILYQVCECHAAIVSAWCSCMRLCQMCGGIINTSN